jgi:hypothetical protein
VPNVEVNITVDSARMGLYDRFLHETRWLPFSKYQLVWDFIRTIEEPPTAELKPSSSPRLNRNSGMRMKGSNWQRENGRNAT